VLDQPLRRVGELDAAALAVEQALAELELELGDLLRDRRRGDLERVRRGAHRAVARDRVEDAQSLEAEHEAILRECSEDC
jgi:hypothetical protein